MLPQPDEQFTLQTQRWQVLEHLGRGEIADTLLVAPLAREGPPLAALRLLRADRVDQAAYRQAMLDEASVLERLNRLEDPDWPSAAGGAMGRLKRAAQTAPQRGVIALLLSGVAPDGRPYTLLELAPPPFRPAPAAAPDDELRALRVMLAVARVVQLCHTHGFTLRDFSTRGEKADRIRVAWEGPHPVSVKVIDWNVTGVFTTEPLETATGHQSTPLSHAAQDRFAAEQAQDLVALGGHLFAALLGQPLTAADGLLPADPSLAQPRWRRLTEGTRLVLRRLLHQHPSGRYATATELCADLDWWVQTLQRSDPLDLEARAANARADRALAAADLALRRPSVGPELQGRLLAVVEREREQALQLGRAALGPALLQLDFAQYRAAGRELDRLLQEPGLDPGLAWEARLYRHVAQIGAATPEGPGRELTVRRARQVCELLRQSDWAAAETVLRSAELDSTPALTRLTDLAQAMRLVATMFPIAVLEQPLAVGLADLAAWDAERYNSPTEVRQALSILDTARELAPDEPLIAQAYGQAQAQLARYKATVASYGRAAVHYRAALELRARALATDDEALAQAWLTEAGLSAQAAALALDEDGPSAPTAAYVGILRARLADYGAERAAELAARRADHERARLARMRLATAAASLQQDDHREAYEQAQAIAAAMRNLHGMIGPAAEDLWTSAARQWEQLARGTAELATAEAIAALARTILAAVGRAELWPTELADALRRAATISASLDAPGPPGGDALLAISDTIVGWQRDPPGLLAIEARLAAWSAALAKLATARLEQRLSRGVAAAVAGDYNAARSILQLGAEEASMATLAPESARRCEALATTCAARQWALSRRSAVIAAAAAGALSLAAAASQLEADTAPPHPLLQPERGELMAAIRTLAASEALLDEARADTENAIRRLFGLLDHIASLPLTVVGPSAEDLERCRQRLALDTRTALAVRAEGLGDEAEQAWATLDLVSLGRVVWSLRGWHAHYLRTPHAAPLTEQLARVETALAAARTQSLQRLTEAHAAFCAATHPAAWQHATARVRQLAPLAETLYGGPPAESDWRSAVALGDTAPYAAATARVWHSLAEALGVPNDYEGGLAAAGRRSPWIDLAGAVELTARLEQEVWAVLFPGDWVPERPPALWHLALCELTRLDGELAALKSVGAAQPPLTALDELTKLGGRLRRSDPSEHWLIVHHSTALAEACADYERALRDRVALERSAEDRQLELPAARRGRAAWRWAALIILTALVLWGALASQGLRVDQQRLIQTIEQQQATITALSGATSR